MFQRYLFIYFVLFAMGHLDWLIIKNIINPTLSLTKKKRRKKEMTYFYTILHKHVKSYKCNCFTLTLFYKTQNRFTQFYTYTKCK